jgi:hypothetical protein
MDLEKMQSKLLTVARADQPGDEVPYAFSGRVMARLKAVYIPDAPSLWAAALWRAAAPCVGVMLLFVAWSVFFRVPAGAATADIAQDLDNTVLAAIDADQPPEIER